MTVIHIALGDLRRVGKDRQAAFWMLAMPLIIAFILGSVFNYVSPQTTFFAVVDLDQSDLSALFIKQMEGKGYWIDRKGPEREPDLPKGTRSCAVVIPPAFEENVLRGDRVKVTLVRGYGSPEKTLDVQLLVTHAIVRFTKALAWANAGDRGGGDERKRALEESLSRAPLLSVEEKGHRFLRPPPVGFNLSLPGFVVMFVLFMVIAYGAGILMEDREANRFGRLVAAPVSLFELYVAKTLARIILALIQAFLLLGCGALLFGVELGDSPLFLVPVIVSLAVFAGCLSVLIGVLFYCETEKQLIQICIFITVVLAALGGCWWPIEIVPEPFRIVALFTPSYWAMRGLQSVMYFGKSYEVLLLECPILLGYAAAVLLIALPILPRLLSKPANG